ncbi:MAG: peptide ABC transporter substrate-binding protein, partial [Candidatus Niyogibacteria bacterium]|nr:peptide ABC transporter substrate-binding protein [Candidatus Niyogibacteria bacterium]
MKQLTSILGRRFDLPSAKELRFIARTLEQKEKIAFWIFFFMFVIGTLGLLSILNDSAATEVPVSGGAYYEGLVGTPRFVNPLITISDADRDLTELVYAGLMKPDGRGGLTPELAEKYEVSPDGLTYTFTLRDGLAWHDREPLTTDDIAFTVKLVQTPLVRSVKRANWEGVTAEVVDPRVIRFHLKKPYAPFLGNTTLEIVPKHIWSGASPEQIALSQFNIEPIGAGPYKIKKVTRNSSGIVSAYTLAPFENYALGEPFIKEIVLDFYNSEAELLRAYAAGSIEAVGALTPKNAEMLRAGSRMEPLGLSRIFGVFFNQSKNQALTDINVRKALALATDKQRIVNDVLSGYGSTIARPIPPGTLGAIENQAGGDIKFDPEAAKALLAKSGWKPNAASGVMEKKVKKNTQPLEISISTSVAPDLTTTANLLKDMWGAAGIKTEVKIFEIGDFDKDVIRSRDYDTLLFGEVVGYDPDPFAFWHSSQRNDPGLNIAMYASTGADKLLEAARKTTDPAERAEKYAALQAEIEKDLPAIFIYSPDYLYIVPDHLKGFDSTNITTGAERFANVNNWYIDTKKVWRF